MPVYEYACRACDAVEEHLQPMGSEAPGPCRACGGELRRRFSRVAVKYQGWGFTSTDKLVAGDRPRKDFRELREHAERIADES
jgi:putative FmdB family regulatory protein